MVRNEVDVIEAMVRHNLTCVDRLVVIDHGSTDGTSEVLAALSREGLPLEVVRDPSLEFRQAQVMTHCVREIFSATDADFVFPLDADEFLRMPSRSTLERGLASLPPHVHAVQELQTYVCNYGLGSDTLATLRSARRKSVEGHGTYRAVVARQFLSTPVLLSEGNHLVVRALGAENMPRVQHAKLRADEVAVAHTPIRSVEQFSAKIALCWLSILMRADRAPQLAYHWSEAYEHIRRGQKLTPAQLTEIALNYGVPEEARVAPETIELLDDPFLADIVLRYGDIGVRDPFALLLSFTERLVNERLALAAPASGAPER